MTLKMSTRKKTKKSNEKGSYVDQYLCSWLSTESYQEERQIFVVVFLDFNRAFYSLRQLSFWIEIRQRLSTEIKRISVKM